MGTGILSRGWVLLLALSFATTGALAQDGFDDEFDEFDTPSDEFEAAQPVAPSPAVEAEDFGEELTANPEAMGARAERLRAVGLRAHNTWAGPTGGIRVIDAFNGASESFRVQLLTDFFSTSDFLVEGDENDHIGASLSFSWAPWDLLEIYASIQTYANTNPAEDPSLFQVLGDTLLGAKLAFALSDTLAVGFDINLALLNSVGDIGVAFGGTSVGFRGSATLDLRRSESETPLVIRFNAQYKLDNSTSLVEDVEQARYDNLDVPDRRAIADETRHLLTRVERFALNINRTDFFNIGLGFEVPIRAGDFQISPMVEWTWGIPINRQGYDCLYIPSETDSESPAAGEDGCLDRQGIGAFPMKLTAGLRVLPAVEGLSFMLAADIGLTGTSTFVRELSGTAPWNIMLGLGYAYDTADPPPAPAPEPIVREVERVVEVPAELPLQGRIRGTVMEQGTETPVVGAIVKLRSTTLTPQVAGDDGRFTTYALDPGEYVMEISHPEYTTGGCAASIPNAAPEEGELIVDVRCDLVALPRVGTVEGTVVGEDGSAINGAGLTLSGPQNRTVRSDAAGRFTLGDMPPGEYNVRIDAEDYLYKVMTLTVAPRETSNPEITLIGRPRRALVTIRRNQIRISRKIEFATDSAEILPESIPLMTEIADVIIRHSEIAHVEIQGHTDNRGEADHNRQLSQSRADSVRTWLGAHGVDTARLSARGFGEDEPMVPNITARNRARNRRVAFMIRDAAPAAPAAE